MIPGSRLLFVASFMLLVQDNEANVVERGKESAPRSQYYGRLSVLRSHPVAEPLRMWEIGMKDRNLRSESIPKATNPLSGQSDFRDQIEHLSPHSKGFGSGP